jgi:hypothetical protein
MDRDIGQQLAGAALFEAHQIQNFHLFCVVELQRL